MSGRHQAGRAPGPRCLIVPRPWPGARMTGLARACGSTLRALGERVSPRRLPPLAPLSPPVLTRRRHDDRRRIGPRGLHPASLLALPLVPLLAFVANNGADAGRAALIHSDPPRSGAGAVEVLPGGAPDVGGRALAAPPATRWTGPSTRPVVRSVAPTSSRRAVTAPAAPARPLPATPRAGQDDATRRLTASGLPVRARIAYAAAAARSATLDRSCHLSWTLLAAIGRVESDHGRAGRAVLGESGRAVPPIYGPRLDGTTPGTGTV